LCEDFFVKLESSNSNKIYCFEAPKRKEEKTVPKNLLASFDP
jgi:hypothetical protein